MPNNTTNDAGAAAPAFVLRELKSSDVWQLVRVLRRFNLREARKLIDQDLVKKSKFEKPMKLVDGELVPMLPDEWTAAQRKAFKAAKAANEELTWQALDILINNISLIVQYVTREGFSDFFMQAQRLLEKTGASRNSIGSAMTLIK